MGCAGCNGCAGKKPMLQMKKTEDYDALYQFFEENGLEVPEDEPDDVDTTILCGYALTSTKECAGDARNSVSFPVKEQLVGGAILAKRQNRYILDGIAVTEEYRNLKVGGVLLKKIVDEVKLRGGDELYLVARAPGFFEKKGFHEIQRDEAPEFFECFDCPQYGNTCHPKVMLLKI